MVTLKQLPLPSMIVELGEGKVLEIWKKKIKQGIGRKRAQKLFEAASESVGCTEGLKIGQKELQYFLNEYKMYLEQLEEIKVEMAA
jgi:hypothetical protein